MKLRLILKTRTWEIACVQSGSATGWSDWEHYNRNDALALIERGWSYETV